MHGPNGHDPEIRATVVTVTEDQQRRDAITRSKAHFQRTAMPPQPCSPRPGVFCKRICRIQLRRGRAEGRLLPQLLTMPRLPVAEGGHAPRTTVVNG